ncbi:hypothetical protein [Caballeronia calidae]|nr:hypothetical protein [Caballeronia calidae]
MDASGRFFNFRDANAGRDESSLLGLPEPRRKRRAAEILLHEYVH